MKRYVVELTAADVDDGYWLPTPFTRIWRP
jgi:hypothetical protein